MWYFQGNEWHYVSGSPVVNGVAPGNAGPKGVFDETYFPAGRANAMMWGSPDGGLWLYGGRHTILSTQDKVYEVISECVY